VSAVHVLGAGSWGTAISLVLSANGHDVTLVARDPTRAAAIRAARENARYLPGVPLPDAVTIATGDDALPAPDVLVFAVPSHGFRETAVWAAACWPSASLVSLTKGLDPATQERMSELLADAFGLAAGQRAVVLAGPSHAEEVAAGLPTVVVAASTDDEAAARAQALFLRPTFRVYTNSDVVGVELGVALKNVIALAAGIGDGLGLGDNARGALVTRGLAEMTRLGVALGGRRETFFGLAGLGDLVATCTSPHSRNRHVGIEVARGRSLDDVLASMTQVAEGVRTTGAARRLAAQHGIEVPIADQVHAVLFDGRPPREAMAALMTRDARAED